MSYQQPQRTVTVQKRGANHGLHLVITLCTFGLWLPFWAVAAILGRKTKTVTYAAPVQLQQPQQAFPPYGQQPQQWPVPVQPIEQYRPGQYYPPQ